jgi:two-component sensor histidine kinase
MIGIAEELLSLELPQEPRKLAQMSLDTATSLKVIISDLLDISKIQATQLHIQLEPFNLAESIERTIALFFRTANEKGVKLELVFTPNLPKIFVGDPVRINQVLGNLITNSLKFTKEGHITIRIKSEHISLDHCNVTVVVEDSGIGIAPDACERIFTEFYSSTESLKQGGTGLGLLLCKQLITLLGGSIHFHSEVGKGSQFWFSLPMEVKADTELPIKPSLLQARGRILVVDDSPVNLKVMAHYLKQAGCSTEFAINGEEAVMLVQMNSYDIVFMDVQMPVMDGLTATREIRSRNKDVPIVGISAGVESGYITNEKYSYFSF